MLYFASLPGVTILLQVHHHTALYVSTWGHNPSKATSPYCMLRLCPVSQCFYKFITMLYLTSLPGVTILLQVHHHTVLYVSARNHNPSTSTSPYCTLRLCPGSQSFNMYITILYFTSLPGSQSFYKYITKLYFTSVTGVTILLQVNHRSALYVSARGHNPSTSTSPFCTIRLSPGSQSLYKHITILYLTSLPGVTIPLQVYHYTVFTSLPGGHNPFTSILRLCPGSQTFYKYITILYFTSLSGVAILLQVHHHTLL